MADQSMNPEKKKRIMTGLLIVILMIIIWQLFGLFSNNTPAPLPSKSNNMSVSTTQKMPQSKPLIPENTIKTAEEKLREAESARYLAAIDELQLLKVHKEIAETNRDIAKAGQETVNAQRNTLEVLSGIMPPSNASGYAANLGAQAAPVPAPTPAPAATNTRTEYVVVSVSMLQGKWAAVLGNQGQLFNVSVGDVIPLDQSKVLAIDRGGVLIADTLGNRKRLSLVPII